jgi:probable rRNA maturation factor
VPIEVIVEDDRWGAVDLDRLAARAGHAALVHAGLDPDAWELCVLACDDSRIATLNADFRGKPAPTNVLSWPAQERAPETPGARPAPPVVDTPEEEAAFLGDIAIAWETCAREAEAAGREVSDHATHLVVHAVLHLLGYDHERDLDATLMETTEVAILGKLGVSDPYCA